MLSKLAGLGLDLRTVADTLQIDGVVAFASDYARVLASTDEMKDHALARVLGPARVFVR